MFKMEAIEVAGRCYHSFILDLGNAPLLIIKAPKGYAMCGYLDIDTAERLNDVAVLVRGVKDLEGMLNAEIQGCTQGAKGLGIKMGMKLKDALPLLS